MLNDLEKRDAFLNENQDHVLDGLYSAYDLELTNKKKSNALFIFSFCLVSALIILACLYFSLDKKFIQIVADNKVLILDESNPVKVQDEIKIKNSDKNNKAKVIEVATDIKNVENINFQSLKMDEKIFLNNEPELLDETKVNYIDSIQFETDRSGINLVIKMPDEIDYLVYGLSNPHRMVIEVENVKLGFRLEDLVPVNPIVAIRYSINNEKRFKLVLESSMPLTIKKSTTSQSGDDHNLVVMMEYQWQGNETLPQEDLELAEIVEKQVEIERESVFKGDIIKTPVTKNSDAYAEKLFQQAYIDYQKGNISESLKKLNMSLNQDAGHVKARSTLALVLSEKKHFDLAYSVLNEGLIQYPDNIEWIKMYARLLLNEGKYVEARSMLAKQKPALVSNADYYALQAAILQKLNEHEEAAMIYRDLLQVSPHRGVWWMGLGISLESLKRYDDALYAYQKASNNSTLAKDSRLFLSQRINRLNNILDDEST